MLLAILSHCHNSTYTEYLVNIVKFNISQFKTKISYLYSSNTPQFYRTLTTSPGDHSHIYKA